MKLLKVSTLAISMIISLASFSEVSVTPAMISQFNAMSQSQKDLLTKQVGVQIPKQDNLINSSIGEIKDLSDIDELSVKVYDHCSDSSIRDLEKRALDSTDDDRDRIEEFIEKCKEENLNQVYGKSFFSRNKSNYTVTDNALVPSDYMLGAGDELIIQLFGKINETYTLQVSREGIINFPKIGPISVLGLSYLDAQRIIKSKINQDFIGVDSMISMGRLRSINIFVTGEVDLPGAYSVSALSTITQALYQSGGINSIGSVRNIEVKRSGEVVNRFDLYDLLINGDSSKDIRMQNADVLHVPPYDAIVNLTGEVKRPMSYEIKKGETIESAIKFAGGFNNNAYNKEIVLINQQGPNNLPAMTHFPVDAKWQDVALRGQDQIRVRENGNYFVTVSGDVFDIGDYPYQEGLTVEKLIKLAGGFLPSANIDNIELISLNVENGIGERSAKNIPSSALGKTILKPYDEIYIRKTNNFNEAIRVTLTGEVKSPGSYVITKDTNLQSLIKRAGGLTLDANLGGMVFNRAHIREKNEEIIDKLIKKIDSHIASKILTQAEFDFSLISSLQGLEENIKKANVSSRFIINPFLAISDEEFILMNNDEIFIPRKNNTISVYGEVNEPGTFNFDEDMSISDYIDMSAGYGSFANSESQYIIKESGRVMRMDKNLAFFGASSTLQPGDSIVVPINYEYKDSLPFWRDITSVLYQGIVSIAALKNL